MSGGSWGDFLKFSKIEDVNKMFRFFKKGERFNGTPYYGITLTVVEKLFSWAQGRDDRKVVLGLLEDYVKQLDRTAAILTLYSEDQIRRSKLAEEVNLGFTACQVWARAAEEKREPKDIRESLRRKTARLQKYIHLESLEQAIEFGEALKKWQDKDGKYHPLYYYEKGKILIVEENWMDAKQMFINYRGFVEGKDPRCKKPEEDNFLHHLGYIEAQILARAPVASDELNMLSIARPISTDKKTDISVLSENYTNSYQKEYLAWRKKYPHKKDAEEDDPLKSINISRLSMGKKGEK